MADTSHRKRSSFDSAQAGRSLHDRFQALNETSSCQASQLASQGKRVRMWDIVCTPGLLFLRTYVWQGRWRHGRAGFGDALFAAYEKFVSSVKLWEKQQANQQHSKSRPSSRQYSGSAGSDG